jgi:hypothetical protein
LVPRFAPFCGANVGDMFTCLTPDLRTHNEWSIIPTAILPTTSGSLTTDH